MSKYIPIAAVFAALALAGCGVQGSIGIHGQALKKGSNCVTLNNEPGHVRQGEDGALRCVKDK